MSDDERERGYGKPPKSGRFKKGQSGNPKGRPKGSKNFSTDVREVLEMQVPVSEGGKKKNVSTQQAALMRLREMALKGDQRALDRLLGFAQTYSREDIDLSEMNAIPESDQVILERYVARQKGDQAEGERDD